MFKQSRKWLAGLLCAGLLVTSLPLTAAPLAAAPSSVSPSFAYGPWAPEEMTVSPDQLKAGEAGVIQVNFDRNYSPAAGDRLEVAALDGQGKKLDKESQEIALDQTATVGAVAVSVRPSAQVSKYLVTYKGAPGNTAKLSRTLKVTGGLADLKPELTYANLRVAPGETVAAPTLALVDQAGNRRSAQAVTFRVTGATVDGSINKDGSFVVAGNAPIGSSIIVTATADGLTATATFTVTRASKTEGIVLKTSSSKGVVEAENDLTFSLQKDGQPVILEWKPTVVRVEFLNGAQAIGYAVDLSKISSGGEGKLVLKSQAATTVQWRLVLSDNAGHRLSTEPVDYTFAAGQPPVQKRTVALDIGSTNLVVDGDMVVAMDSAPVVVNSRTYVPYRAVAQAFGAKVTYNHAARTVTTTLGEQKIVMTLDQKTYQLNGASKQMDVAPYVNQAGRTMVPVRFVAEALGFQVTPRYRGNGTTQGVSFSR